MYAKTAPQPALSVYLPHPDGPSKRKKNKEPKMKK